MQKRTFTLEEKEQVINLYVGESWGLKRIAKELHCSRPSLRRLLKEEGIERHKQGRPKVYQSTQLPELYNIWHGIKNRCSNTTTRDYQSYGARGITMYKPWIDNYYMFEEYVYTNLGERPKGTTLDRINNDGNYEPGNIRWASPLTQARNRSLTQI